MRSRWKRPAGVRRTRQTDRRLGVLKDGIAAVDLAISWNGREWFSDVGRTWTASRTIL